MLQEALATRANAEGDDALDIGDDGASQAPPEVKRILSPSLPLLLLLRACVFDQVMDSLLHHEARLGDVVRSPDETSLRNRLRMGNLKPVQMGWQMALQTPLR